MDLVIAELVENLEPARPLQFARGVVFAFAGLVLAFGLVTFRFGIRPDLAAGHPDGMFFLAGGLFLMLGIACTAACVAMSNPRVGSGRNGWGWAVAAAGVLPLAALAIALFEGKSAWIASEPAHGVACLGYSVGLGLIVATVLISWLRRGAPALPECAGLLTGIAAGCAGVVALTFVCPINSIMHIGLWHGLAVTVSALAGWLIVPRLVRW